MPSPQILIAIAAGIGGVAPNLVHLAQGFVRETPNIPGAMFYAGVAIFFALGAAVAFIFAETDARKAFFLGISLPAFIAAAQSHTQPRATPAADVRSSAPTPAEDRYGLLLGLMSSAHAQPASKPPLTDNGVGSAMAKSIAVQPLVACSQCEVWFLNSEGKVLKKEHALSANTISRFAVPKDATQFGIVDAAVNLKLYDIPTGSTATPTFEFSHRYNPWKDLRRGLGDYDLRSYDPVVKLK